MERLLSQDERIRRAEEIYARRQSLRERTKRATVNVADEPKNFGLLKKLALQITICMLMYFIFYLINTTNYSFSESTLNKTDEIISHDTDFVSIYNSVIEAIRGYIFSNDLEEKQEGNNLQELNGEEQNIEHDEEKNNTQSSESNENNSDAQGENEQNQEQSNTEQGQNVSQVDTMQTNAEVQNVEGGEVEEEATGQTEISKLEVSETDRIKSKYSFILPTTGYITSEFGTREATSSIVSTYHKGIDIGANTGTKVVASTNGKVIISRESPTYGKYIMLEEGEVKTVYAHCSELLVKVRR